MVQQVDPMLIGHDDLGLGVVVEVSNMGKAGQDIGVVVDGTVRPVRGRPVDHLQPAVTVEIRRDGNAVIVVMRVEDERASEVVDTAPEDDLDTSVTVEISQRHRLSVDIARVLRGPLETAAVVEDDDLATIGVARGRDDLRASIAVDVADRRGDLPRNRQLGAKHGRTVGAGQDDDAGLRVHVVLEVQTRGYDDHVWNVGLVDRAVAVVVGHIGDERSDPDLWLAGVRPRPLHLGLERIRWREPIAHLGGGLTDATASFGRLRCIGSPDVEPGNVARVLFALVAGARFASGDHGEAGIGVGDTSGPNRDGTSGNPGPCHPRPIPSSRCFAHRAPLSHRPRPAGTNDSEDPGSHVGATFFDGAIPDPSIPDLSERTRTAF